MILGHYLNCMSCRKDCIPLDAKGTKKLLSFIAWAPTSLMFFLGWLCLPVHSLFQPVESHTHWLAKVFNPPESHHQFLFTKDTYPYFPIYCHCEHGCCVVYF